ncbi:MAG: EthD domain-containing protein [Caldimonas sp.]
MTHERFVDTWRAAGSGRSGLLRNVVDQNPPEVYTRPEFDGIEIVVGDAAGSAEGLREVLDPETTTFVRAREFAVLDRGFGPVKFMSLLRRKEGTTPEEFSDYWFGSHAPLVKTIVEVSKYFKGYVQNHCVPETRVGGREVDGIVEIWFSSLEDLRAAMFSSNYMGDLRADEANFVALPNRRMLVVEDSAT